MQETRQKSGHLPFQSKHFIPSHPLWAIRTIIFVWQPLRIANPTLGQIHFEKWSERKGKPHTGANLSLKEIWEKERTPHWGKFIFERKMKRKKEPHTGANLVFEGKCKKWEKCNEENAKKEKIQSNWGKFPRFRSKLEIISKWCNLRLFHTSH